MRKPNRLLGFLVPLALLMPTLSHADIEPGDWRISASISAITYDETKLDSTKFKTTGLGVAPTGLLRIGKLTADRVELGMGIGAAFEEIRAGSVTVDATLFEFIPYVALNIPIGSANPGRSMFFSPSLGVGYSGAFGDTFDLDAIALEVGAEFKFFVAKDASVDLGLFFSYLSGDGKRAIAAFAPQQSFDLERWSIGPRLSISIWP